MEPGYLLSSYKVLPPFCPLSSVTCAGKLYVMLGYFMQRESTECSE